MGEIRTSLFYGELTIYFEYLQDLIDSEKIGSLIHSFDILRNDKGNIYSLSRFRIFQVQHVCIIKWFNSSCFANIKLSFLKG